MRFWSSRAALSGAREPANSFARRRGVEIRRKRLFAQARSVGDGIASASLARQIHEAEASRIVIGDGLAVIEMQHDVIVLRVLRALAMEIAGRRHLRSLDAERARHAEMGDQGFAAVEPKQKIFRAPVERDDPPPGQPLSKRGGKGKRMSCRRNSTLSMRAPTIAGSRPRRTVSTSGSSGMGVVPCISRFVGHPPPPSPGLDPGLDPGGRMVPLPRDALRHAHISPAGARTRSPACWQGGEPAGMGCGLPPRANRTARPSPRQASQFSAASCRRPVTRGGRRLDASRNAARMRSMTIGSPPMTNSSGNRRTRNPARRNQASFSASLIFASTVSCVRPSPPPGSRSGGRRRLFAQDKRNPRNRVRSAFACERRVHRSDDFVARAKAWSPPSSCSDAAPERTCARTDGNAAARPSCLPITGATASDTAPQPPRCDSRAAKKTVPR